MKAIKVKDVMTCDPFMIRPQQNVKEAARYMKDVDCGVLPVGDVSNVIGMITDRDITLRVTAEGKDPSKTLVQDVMTRKVYSCNEDDDIEAAAESMRKNKVARLVVNKGRRTTGIVTMTELLDAKGDHSKGDKVLHTLLKPENKSSAAKAGTCN